ncbi:SSI family serine proteinase inhibitor [Blastococcus goldschmidtiae]|uniref:SSI family serine proteinase inhibitor n=1 Tax=Blastococcus goldschmidtiae TaxID=3075546 RepID=A0ABU2KE08_9ACTN|nr:SSI family serine proteinase inhibitor [Blastococcus sp. DSM 46792]MDT0278420.1 SSI family serine proteinase inhibitor [Blastococcus sp. DSM 46792]
MPRLLPLLLVAAALTLAGCGSADEEGTAAAPTTDTTPDQAEGVEGTDGAAAGGGITQADNDLQVEIDLGDGAAPETWTLTCVGFVEGSHPTAEAACEHLKGMEDPFAPLPTDVMCSQQYGGPETARVVGRWGGEPVDLELSRVNGCRIDQWNSLVPLVPAPAS